MASVASNPIDFEEEAKKAREFYMCKTSAALACHTNFIDDRSLDGDYSKGITFYKLAIDKLRRYCQTLTNPVEKKRGVEVRSSIASTLPHPSRT